jgi:hypothetical protein
MSKVIKLNEDKIEKLVRRIIKEEEEQSQVKEKSTTLTRHPAYPAIDRLETALEELKMEFKRDVANAVSGADGYHSEIDKFSEDFGKFINKVSQLKRKINEYKIEAKKKEVTERERYMQEKRKMEYQKREQAYKNGDKYSY